MAGLFTKVEKKKRVDYKFKVEESTVKNIDEIQDKLNKVNEVLTSQGDSKLAFDLDDKMNATLKRTVAKGLKEISELYESLVAGECQLEGVDIDEPETTNVSQS